MVVGGLHAHVVHEALAGDFVVGFEDVVEVLDGVLCVASGRAPDHGVDFDHRAVPTDLDRLVFEGVSHALGTTVEVSVSTVS